MTTYLLFLFIIFALMMLARIRVNCYSKDILLNVGQDLHLNKKHKGLNRETVCFYVLISIVYFFSAARFGIGWDFKAYYDTIEHGLSTNIINNGEVFTILIVRLSTLLKQSQLYFAINSAICIFLVAATSKKYSKDPWMSILFFVTFPLFYLNSFSVIRNFSAIAIAFYGIRYIQEKKLIKYIIVVIIACMFHKSAIIAITFYFIKDIKLKTSKLIVLLLSLPILRMLMIFIVMRFLPRYSVYLQSTTIQEGTKAIFVFLAIAIIFILFRKYIVSKNKNAGVYFNFFMVGLSIYLMFFQNGTMGHRLSLYGTIYSILLVPDLIYLFKDKRERVILKTILYLFCILIFLYTVNVGKGTYIPYNVFF